jgi:hypothetical protein
MVLQAAASRLNRGKPITADAAPLVVGGNGSRLKSFKWTTLLGCYLNAYKSATYMDLLGLICFRRPGLFR